MHRFKASERKKKQEAASQFLLGAVANTNSALSRIAGIQLANFSLLPSGSLAIAKEQDLFLSFRVQLLHPDRAQAGVGNATELAVD